MEALALYLFRSSVWLTGFALVYALFLRNERFFTLNRIYLVSGILVSIIFPLFTWHYTVLLPFIPSIEVSEPQMQGIVVPEQSFNPESLLLYGYLAGILFLVFRILRQTLPVFSIIKKSETHPYRSVRLIRTDAYPASFSFFSFVFVNPSIDEIETNEIVNHELEHIRQQHWIDLLLFEILRTMQWFNPVSWLYGHLIRQNHEYQADEHALQHSSNPAIYRAALLNQMFGGPVISLANSFNYSLNKKRFNMMKHTIKSPLRKLKLLLVLPLMAGVFYAFATPEYKFQQAKENSRQDDVLTIQDAKTLSNGKNKDQASLKDSVTTLKGNFVSLSSKDSASGSGLKFNAKNVQISDKNGSTVIKADTISVDFAKSKSLFLIDGKEATKAEVDQLNPDKIESVNVLNGESATTKYGEKGKNGVVFIKMGKVVVIEEDSKSKLPPTIHLQTNSPLKFGTSDDSGKQPLIVKDGVIVEGMNVNNIPPETIESINVLKGEQATKIYGNKGINGVILITTKKGNVKDLKTTSEPIPVNFKGSDQTKNASDQTNSATSVFEKNSLLVIDGVISEMHSPNKTPNDSIASISILKGEPAIRKYGEKGKHGVMEITTKKGKSNEKLVQISNVDANKVTSESFVYHPNNGNIMLKDPNGKPPLFVVDGKILKSQNIKDIPPETIESVNVLKGETAISKYGDKGKNGVLLITSKKGTSNTQNGTIDVKVTGDANDQKANTSKIGNITWVNNTIYSSAKLNKVLGMKKGDEYSKEKLNSRIWSDLDGVSSLYLDNGYVFSNIKTSEDASNDGTINLTFTIYEGNRGKIGKVDIKGNKNVPTKDILNKIEIKPGDVFSKTKIVQSVRAIGMMGKFNPEETKPEITPGSKIPNSEFINVDLVFNVTEK